MSKVLVEESNLTAIASAIRSKLGVQTAYKPGQMATAIGTIHGEPVLETLSATANGSYSPSTGKDGFSAVTVNVPNTYAAGDEGKVVSSGALVAQTARASEITANGTYDTTTNNSVTVNVSGGGGRLYTNGTIPAHIADVSGYTKLYDTTIKFGNYGAKVNTALAITSEATLNANMNLGWNGSGSCFYDAENLIGAYGGYDFGQAVDLMLARFWIGRYSGQNKTLYVEVQYLDGEGDWHDVQTLEVTKGIDYPLNVFDVYFIGVDDDIYGVRWVHRDEPMKSSNNNVIFFGMMLYEASNTPVYIPRTTGLIEPPTGYDGFGPLYI